MNLFLCAIVRIPQQPKNLSNFTEKYRIIASGHREVEKHFGEYEETVIRQDLHTKVNETT